MKDKKEEQVKVKAKIIVQVKLWNDLLNVANNANRVRVKKFRAWGKVSTEHTVFFCKLSLFS